MHEAIPHGINAIARYFSKREHLASPINVHAILSENKDIAPPDNTANITDIIQAFMQRSFR